MKIIAVFLISVVMVYSQSREAEQKQFEWNLSGTTTTAYLSTIHPSNPQSVKDYFKSDNFILGWHWGGEKIISKVMKSSQCDLTTAWSWPLETNYLIPDSYNDNTNLFVRSSWQAYQSSTSYDLYTHCKYDDQIMFTKSLCYSAALIIDENDPYHLIKLENDTENNIFGFRFKGGGEVIKDLSDNKWKLKLVKSEANPNNPILADPWPNNLLSYTDEGVDNINENFSGRCFYVSINLRRLENNGFGDVPVLKIEVPYWYKQGNSRVLRLAFFDKVPNNIQGDFNSNDYGRYWNLTDALNQDQQIIITKNMLPTFDSDFNGDITISAYIVFDGNINVNRRLKEHNLSVAEGQIDSLNLKVTYLGNCDIAINWIKFETKNTQDLLRGLHDQKIIYGIQKDMNKLTESGFRSKNIKPKRFTINVEGSPINWPAERHFSKLVGNIISGSNGIALPNHYEYFINPADKWYSFSKITPTVANPFCKVNAWSPIWQTFGLQAGYQERWGTNILNNLHQSEWETYLKYATSNLSTSQFVQEARVQDISIYRADEHVKYTGGPISIQAYWEHIIYNNLIQDFTKGALFQETPWFAQSFVEGYAKNTDNRWVANDPDGTRIVTGEEYKLMNWLPVILGAKGLLYDGDADVSWTGGNTPNIRLLPSENVLMFRTNLNQEQLNALSDYEFINLNESTNDFLDDSYEHLHIIPSPPDKLTIANTIGTTPDRIFMGKQSVRNEMYKLHTWIRNNEEELMNLQLKAWYGIGYKLWYLQDPKILNNPDIMSKYIDKSNIKTIKFVDENGYHPEGIEESNFESFCDITILADKVNDEDMSDVFYIGAQNRRTDPLVYTYDSSFTNINGEPWEYDIYPGFRFYSTHEMETNCDNGGFIINPSTLPDWGDPGLTCVDQFEPASYWRNLYWKRQGVREIRVKFKYEKPGNHDKVLLRVQELLAENEPLTNMNGTPGSTPEWWRQERWNNAVKDTVIRSDGELVLKMLPGSGRMFKVTVEETQDIVGELANSNQTKIIAYPAHQTSNQDYSGHDDSVYYHMVYHRKIDGTNRYGVYYRRSKNAYLHNMNTKTIQWGTEQSLANVIRLNRDIEPQLNVDTLDGVVGVSCDCKYPTLTARYDTDNQTAKIYVVFNCEGWILPDTPKVYIFERSFPIDAGTIMPTPLDPIGYAYASDVSNGLMIDRWGVPTINASLNGNFYAWNDTLLGIKAGFKRPENSGYITNLISFKFNDNTNYNALFPSLKTFSMIPYGEENASLVWQETTNEFLPNASSKIYYTMLRTDQDLDIYHYAPPTVCDPNEPYFWDFTRKISDPNVLCISPNPPLTYYTFPQIYRNVESVMDNGNILALAAGDRVYWQGGVTNNVRSSIYAKMIDIGSYDCFNFMYPKKIYSNLTQLGQPNASQGDLNLDPAQGPFNWSDSSYVVNFIEYASNTNPPDYNSNIYQFHHNYWGFFSLPGGDRLPSEEFYQNLTLGQSPIGQGLYPHLVESSVLRKAGD